MTCLPCRYAAARTRFSKAIFIVFVCFSYWRIGHYIVGELDALGNEKYGAKIVGTVSRQLLIWKRKET